MPLTAVGGINRILQDILHDPLDQLLIHADRGDQLVAFADLDVLPQVRDAAAEVADRLADDRCDVLHLEPRETPYLPEAHGHLLQPFRIVLHLVEDLADEDLRDLHHPAGMSGLHLPLAQELHPAEERGDRGAELVRGLLGQTDPDGALLALFDAGVRHIAHGHEEENGRDLHHRNPSQAIDDGGHTIVNATKDAAVGREDIDGTIAPVEVLDVAAHVGGVGPRRKLPDTWMTAVVREDQRQIGAPDHLEEAPHFRVVDSGQRSAGAETGDEVGVVLGLLLHSTREVGRVDAGGADEKERPDEEIDPQQLRGGTRGPHRRSLLHQVRFPVAVPAPPDHRGGAAGRPARARSPARSGGPPAERQERVAGPFPSH